MFYAILFGVVDYCAGLVLWLVRGVDCDVDECYCVDCQLNLV